MNEFLTMLAKGGFVPSPEALAAGPVGLPLPSEARAAMEVLERKRVEAFKAEFWSLAPAERQARWETLRACLRFETNIGEMDRLTDALSLTLPEGDVATLVGALFLMTPRACAIERMRWLAEHGHRPEIRREAAGLAQLQFLDEPLFVMLGVSRVSPASGFFQPQFSSFFEPSTDQSAMTNEYFQHNVLFAVAGLSSEKQKQLAADKERRLARQYGDSQPKQRQSFFRDFLGTYLKVILAMACFMACFTLCMEDNYQRRKQNSQPPVPPRRVGPNVEEMKRIYEEVARMTPEELRACEQFVPGPGKAPPPGYQSWMKSAGKQP